MPELPEVETIARQLNRHLPGARITAVMIRLPKLIKVAIRRFRRAVVKSRVRWIHRRAKLLLVELSSGVTMVIHLKMSGQLIWQPAHGRAVIGGHPIPGGTEALPNKYTHVVFITNRGRLYFNDQRQFGFLKLMPTATLRGWLEDQGYGPEPLSHGFTLEAFVAILRRHRVKRLKSTLMDQRVIAGIGNIYADEACHVARLKPWRRIRTLTATERRALFHALGHVIRLSLKHHGTSAEHYRTTDGQKGRMSRFLRVYRRAGQPCRRGDGGVIKKITLQGRGTHYCPVCQR
jgi:formamidopyrimidine-DNA glycosylase